MLQCWRLPACLRALPCTLLLLCGLVLDGLSAIEKFEVSQLLQFHKPSIGRTSLAERFTSPWHAFTVQWYKRGISRSRSTYLAIVQLKSWHLMQAWHLRRLLLQTTSQLLKVSTFQRPIVISWTCDFLSLDGRKRVHSNWRARSPLHIALLSQRLADTIRAVLCVHTA